MSFINISAAIAETEKLLASLKAFDGTPGSHITLLNQTDKVRSKLEEPYDVVTRLFENLSVSGALKMLLGIGALQKLPSDAGMSIKAADLAAAVNVNVTAITRAMRVIVVQGIANETGPDEYTHNSLSLSFLPEATGSFFLLCMDMSKAWSTLPEYFKSHAPEDLYDLMKSPFAFSEGKEGRTYYDVLNDYPEQRLIWDAALKSAEKNFPIRGMFPWESLKEQVEEEPVRPFVVDVGGGKGQSLLAIQDDCRAFGGKLILQDLPIVINSLKPDEIPNIEATVYDIFTPQPVKNAHVYFFRRLLHDFYNPVCVEILKNTVSAMGPDSRLIVCDMLVPSRVTVGVPMQLYWLDFALMLISGKEKTIEEFLRIFDAAGLELVKVYSSGVGETVMLETRLKKAA